MRLSIAERLALYSVDDPSGCKIWIGAKDDKGYGRVFHNGRNRQASRVALELKVGRPLLRSEHSRHTCDRPDCIREEHLLLGDHASNMRDMADRGRTRGAFGAGDSHPLARITEDQAIAIVLDGRRVCEISRSLGLPHSLVSNVRNGRTWRTPAVDDARRKLAGNPARDVTKSDEGISVVHGHNHEASHARVSAQAFRVQGEAYRERD